jgi:hypothetical protein
MRLPWAAVIVATAATVTGCGSERDQVQAKVEQFATAVVRHDYKTLCSQVLARDLIVRLASGGVSCEQAMKIGLGRVQQPTLAIGKITVSGARASVLTLSGARGQRTTLASIQLVKTGPGWRISSLGSPVTR